MILLHNKKGTGRRYHVSNTGVTACCPVFFSSLLLQCSVFSLGDGEHFPYLFADSDLSHTPHFAINCVTTDKCFLKCSDLSQFICKMEPIISATQDC